LHLVGDGPELIFYKELVKQYNLTEYIVFYGILINEELTKVYNKSDIAICSLGNHRKDIYFTSELKSREYLARGIPMISSTKIDVLPDDFKYCFYVPEDESPVDMFAVVKYYQNLIENNDINEISREIRNFAENNCDMSITMKPIISYLLND
jgi:glycosyltransferase involved in cell wall biosynthesis